MNSFLRTTRGGGNSIEILWNKGGGHGQRLMEFESSTDLGGGGGQGVMERCSTGGVWTYSPSKHNLRGLLLWVVQGGRNGSG